MAFARRTLTESQAERRKRLLVILPEVLLVLGKKKEDLNLKGLKIKEIIGGILGVEQLLSSLNNHDTIHDCFLSTVIGSAAVGNMYYAATGKRALSDVLKSDYRRIEEVFSAKSMKVPLVLQELHKRYRRFDTPADDKETCVPDPCRRFDI